ncbi:MAG: patatin-like phospholipase family protein [Betaproteobacteria bacterium]|jgi:NTE family protein|nr:patatin-like phospholipase family protein [Betaproteobacteria bacterium]MDH4293828.1 patatin-like phospholipase family protein [Betaproteobacteria bacterium]MDH5342442.1 patatin-like phospholipase family protein [Betaproteobacteria bacterium]
MRRIAKFLAVLTVGVLAGCATAPVNYTAADAPYAAPLVRFTAPRPVIGLVLGAGGSRGFAHVGVLKALEAAGIEADVIVGVSSGAVVSALHAGGMRAAALESAALGIEDNDLLDFTLFGPGIIEGGRLQDYINDMLNNRPIEALTKPFAVVAAERVSSHMTVFTRGNTGLAVRASASVPKLFWPVVIRGVEYVDGGVASRVPASVARDMGADIVIAVDVSWRGSIDAQQADVVIRPKTVRSRITDFSHKLANLSAGEEAALAAVPQIRDLLVRVAAEKARPLQVGVAARR